MSGNYPAGVTDNHPEFDMPNAAEPNRDDAIDALQQAGMEPMDTAPRDREITIVLEETLKKQRAFWQDGIFGGGSWMDADGDGAPDSAPWLSWYPEEVIGWLPINEIAGGER